MQGLGELCLHGVLGDAELLGDLAMRKVFEFAEDENFTATRRQGGNRLCQQVGFLPAADGLDHTGRIIEDARTVDFRYRGCFGGGPAAEKIAGGIARRGKKQTAGGHDRTALAGSKQPGVGLLHEVVDVGRVGQHMQVAAQRHFVRLHFLGKPAGVVGG